MYMYLFHNYFSLHVYVTERKSMKRSRGEDDEKPIPKKQVCKWITIGTDV